MNPALIATTSGINISKIIKIIVIIIAVIVGYHYLKKYIKNRKNKAVLNELDKDINVSKLSYQLSYYGIWANDLFTAMEGVGTDEDAIYDIFKKMQTKDDVLQLITAFGVEDEETLTQWIASELSTDERDTLNRLLSDKNINYQF